MNPARILLVYTGGTIGSFEDPETGELRPFEFEHLRARIPEIEGLDVQLDFESLSPIDSSDMSPERWGEIARLLFHRRDRYEGFVILHGTDTMAYTASALSFMLPQFGKPIVITGSQLPIGVMRTDGKENLLTAIEIAGKWDSADPERGPLIREVVIYFGDDLLRGNRAHKADAEGFQALVSPNFPALAEVGVHVRFRRDLLLRPRGEAELHEELHTGVTIVHLIPGITPEAVAHQLAIPGLRAAILRTYGSGNAPRDPLFLGILAAAQERGIFLVNVTQCTVGSVDANRYVTGAGLARIGVEPSLDITLEAAVTKLMVLAAIHKDRESLRAAFKLDLAGEQTPADNIR
ncbi:MAG: asparaginase [Flavobacteriales bacterium]|nr:asparaginase [Flavobacteriales bacterium]